VPVRIVDSFFCFVFSLVNKRTSHHVDDMQNWLTGFQSCHLCGCLAEFMSFWI